MRRWPVRLLRFYVAAMCVCLLAPIVIVVILAFSGNGYLHFPPTALSLQWFARFFGNPQWQRALLSSLIIGAIACVVSTTIGFFAAYAFLRADFRGMPDQADSTIAVVRFHRGGDFQTDPAGSSRCRNVIASQRRARAAAPAAGGHSRVAG